MTIFTEALARPDLAERAAYLDGACGGDAELRRQVEELLAANLAMGRFLEPNAVEPDDPTHPPTDATAAFEPQPQPPTEQLTGAEQPDAGRAPRQAEPVASTVIAGRYSLVEIIGEGGMGSVYLAEQTEPVKRHVALKLIKGGTDSKAVLARFEAERQALALMDHPNIARVYDGGTTGKGQPFFVMELVRGVPLTDYCDQHRLPVRARLELFVSVCQAVQHAHQKGIIHRDLKPGNVLVTEVDGRPTPKVIDFGVAKATELKLTDLSYADTGAIVGTPAYMSPEQADPSSMDIDTRSDVYALGVMLYELLVGSPPIDARQFKRGAILEMLRMVREVDPPRPSTKLSGAEDLPNIAANRDSEPARLAQSLCGELDWVVMKALEKDRTRRYDTANSLARDLQRYLADEVVEARPPSAGYRLKKFVRRHKGQVLAASLVLLTLIGGIFGTSVGLVQADRSAEEERSAKVAAQDAAEREKQAAAGEKEARNAERERGDDLKYQLGVSSMVLASAAYDNRDVVLAAERLEKVPEEQRGWEWRYLKQQTRGGVYTLEADQSGVLRVAFSSDGERIVSGGAGASGGGEGKVKVWDARTGTPLFVLNGFAKRPGGMQMTSFSLGGKWIAAATRDNKATVWDTETGKLQAELKHIGQATPVALSPDGTRIVTVDGTAKVWNVRTGALQSELRDTGSVTLVSSSPDGSRIVTVDKTVKVWDAQTGTELLSLTGYKGRVGSVSFSPDGARIAVLAAGAMVWDAKTGMPLYELPMHGQGLCSVSFSPDGTRIVTGGADGTAKVWDAKIGTPLFELKGRTRSSLSRSQLSIHRLGAQSVSFSPDGTRIGTVGGPLGAHEATVWDARTGTELLALIGHTSFVLCASFSPDGTRIVTGSADGTAKVWDARTGTPRLEMNGPMVDVFSMALSADGTRMVTGGEEYNKPGEARVWDARTGKTLFDLKGLKGSVWGVAISSDGTRIATAGGESDEPGQVTVWDGRTGAVLLKLKGLEEGVNSVSFSPDGTRIVTGGLRFLDRAAKEEHSGGTELKVWDARTGAVQLDLTGSVEKPGFVSSEDWRGGCVAFSPDGTRFVAAGIVKRRPSTGKDVRSNKWVGDMGGVNEATVYDAQTGSALLELKGHQGVVQCVAFSRDGKYIVTGGGDEDRTAKVWDARTGKPLPFELKGHTGAVLSAAFSPDGTRVVTGSADKTVRVWDARTGTALVELKCHGAVARNRNQDVRDQITSVAFSPDGTQLLTGQGGVVRVWDPRPGKDVPDEEELAYRRLHTQPNVWRYREGYEAARAAKDDFAARFYLDRLIEFHTATNQPDEAKTWQTEREKYPELAPPPQEEK
jgi:WD40 repeat protein